MDGTITISSSSSSATAPAEKKAFREETLNQITHGIGLALSLAGAVVLVETAVSNGSFARIVGCCVYAASLVALYAASTLSHSFDNLERRNHWRMLDQVCIFLFIAGGFTPFVLVHMRENWGWALLGLIWAGALWGARARFRTGGESIAPKYFIALAWVPIVAMAQIMHIGHELGAGLVLGGAAAYMLGTVFLVNDGRRPYFHAIWHILVIIGTICHFLFILFYVAQPLAKAA